MNGRALAVTLAFLATAASAAPTVQVTEGKLSGARSEGVDRFLGIPFAASTGGENRWRAPRPAQSWTGIRLANTFGPNCPQPKIPKVFGAYTEEYLSDHPANEDCLRLNIWTPARSGANLPVMVWIHGGGFVIGSGSVPIYDGEQLAKHGIVVVSINYRLGAFGFFASPEFRNTGGGNFGLEDQIAALRWIQRNIASFGGDPRKVTIAGQSAGAISVHELMLSPEARGLFVRGIAESGIGLGLAPSLYLAPRDVAERTGAKILSALGVNSVDQARLLPVDHVAEALAKAKINSTPYADGALLPADPASALRSGQYNDMPILLGLNADEGSALNTNYRLSDPATYTDILKQRFGPLAAEAATLYPWSGHSPFPNLLRDSGIASVDFWAQARARTSRYPAYAYLFTYVEPGPDSQRYGAFHTSEVPYIFENLSKAQERHFTDVDRRMSTQMSAYWVNFVKTGNPNGRGLPAWSPFGKSSMIIDLGTKVLPYSPLSSEKLDLFRRHLAAGGSLLVM